MPERKVNDTAEDLDFGGQCFVANGSISKKSPKYREIQFRVQLNIKQ